MVCFHLVQLNVIGVVVYTGKISTIENLDTYNIVKRFNKKIFYIATFCVPKVIEK